MELKQLTLYHSKSLNVPIYIASEVDKVPLKKNILICKLPVPCS